MAISCIFYSHTDTNISTFSLEDPIYLPIFFRSDSALMTAKGEWEERKRFLCYSLYGWGLPLIIVALIALFKQLTFVPSWMQPLLGDAKCVLYSGKLR